MSFKPRKPSDFWKSETSKKSEVEAKKSSFQLILPYEEVSLKDGTKTNYFDMLLIEFARNSEGMFIKDGYLDLDDMWARSGLGIAKSGRERLSDGRKLIDVYPKPFGGCKLYQGDISLEGVQYWDDKEKKFIQVKQYDKQVMNLGGIFDKYDEKKQLVKLNYNKVNIRLNSYNVLINDSFGKPLPPPAEGESYEFFPINGSCGAFVRDEIAKYDVLLKKWNESNPDEQCDKLDCFFVTDELKDPPANSKAKNPRHSMKIQLIYFM